MNTIDVNCFWGTWPFRKLYKNRFSDLKAIHKENGIGFGYVSCMNSIFYNDPFEGDEDLHQILENTPYQQILTVNPTLPAFEADIEKGVRQFGVRGVRVFPGYHGYSLDDSRFLALCAILKKYHLPLLLTMRVEDERLDYLYLPRRIGVPDELLKFIDTVRDIPVLLMSLRYGEMLYCEDALRSQPNLYMDTSGLKGSVGCMEQVMQHIGDRKILYGSQYPLNALKSTLFEVTMAKIPQESKDRILGGNAADFFSLTI